MNNSKKIPVGIKEQVASAYLEDLAAILLLPSSISDLLILLVQIALENGILILERAMKVEIVSNLGITFGTLDNYLSSLGKVRVIQRISRGKFQINSYFLSLKTLDTIDLVQEEKTVFRMSISYLSSGEKKIEARLVE